MTNAPAPWTKPRIAEAIIRGVFALGALALAVIAFVESIYPNFWSTKLDGVPSQSLRDFVLVMVSYLFLCIVWQDKISFRFDAVVLLVVFALWTAGTLWAIFNDQSNDFLSLLAVIVAIAVAVLGPLSKQGTRFIWRAP